MVDQLLGASHNAWGVFWKLLLNPLVLGLFALIGFLVFGFGFVFNRKATAGHHFAVAVVSVLMLMVVYAILCVVGVNFDSRILSFLVYVLNVPAVSFS